MEGIRHTLASFRSDSRQHMFGRILVGQDIACHNSGQALLLERLPLFSRPDSTFKSRVPVCPVYNGLSPNSATFPPRPSGSLASAPENGGADAPMIPSRTELALPVLWKSAAHLPTSLAPLGHGRKVVTRARSPFLLSLRRCPAPDHQPYRPFIHRAHTPRAQALVPRRTR